MLISLQHLNMKFEDHIIKNNINLETIKNNNKVIS